MRTPPPATAWRLTTLALCVVATAFAFWNAAEQYFIWDEWTYWTERHALLEQGDVAAFFLRQYGGHWIALTMAVWGVLDPLIGARVYLPYVGATILVHAGAGYLLFSLLSEARLRPAVATAATAVYLFLASAAGNVSFGWQICFVAPIAFGYLALLAVVRQAALPRRMRAAWIVASVAAAIMSGGAGVSVLVIAVAAAVLTRQLRLAAACLVLPGGMYALWRDAYEPLFYPLQWARRAAYASFASEALLGGAGALVRIDVAVALWLAVGAAVVATGLALREDRRTGTIPAAAFAGALFFCVSLATQRTGFPSFAGPTQARYVHVIAAWLLPAFAVLVDRLVAVHRAGPVLAGAWLVWALAGNMRDFVRWNDGYVTNSQEIRTLVAATVALGPALDAAASERTPYGLMTFGMNIGTVRHLLAEHKLPCDRTFAHAARMATRLGLPVPSPITLKCPASP